MIGWVLIYPQTSSQKEPLFLKLPLDQSKLPRQVLALLLNALQAGVEIASRRSAAFQRS
jgi:hypothetical protein